MYWCRLLLSYLLTVWQTVTMSLLIGIKFPRSVTSLCHLVIATCIMASVLASVLCGVFPAAAVRCVCGVGWTGSGTGWCPRSVTWDRSGITAVRLGVWWSKLLRGVHCQSPGILCGPSIVSLYTVTSLNIYALHSSACFQIPQLTVMFWYKCGSCADISQTLFIFSVFR